MKMLIASDLHGSAFYTGLLVRRIEEEKPDQVLLLGDLLYHGPRNDLPKDYDTKKTAALLNSIAPLPLCIRGNCDAEVDQMVLSFPILSESASVFTDGRAFYLTHGHHLEEAASAVWNGAVILYGHTHVPVYSCADGVVRANPGSVSLPKNGSAHSYLICENGDLVWRDVESGETLRRESLPD